MPRETETEIACRLGNALTGVPMPSDCHVAIFVFRSTPEGLYTGVASGIEIQLLKRFVRYWWRLVKTATAPKETIN